MELKRIITCIYILAIITYAGAYFFALKKIEVHPVLIKAFSEVSANSKAKELLGEDIKRNLKYTFEKKGGRSKIYEFSIDVSGKHDSGIIRGRTTSADLNDLRFKYLNLKSPNGKVVIYKAKRKGDKTEK
jgi:hypothetical protein